MPMVHVRVVCATKLAEQVRALLADQPGAVAVTCEPVGTSSPDDAQVCADLARESVNSALNALRAHGVDDHAFIALEPIDTAIGRRTEHAEHEAPGKGDDALIWDELTARTGGESTLTGAYLAFMVLATLLAGIGVLTDSPVTVVGAMVVGPEFSTLAGVAVGMMRRRWRFVRHSAIALTVGFVVAIAAACAATLLGRATGLVHKADLSGLHNVDYIYHPGWFSLITALIAGCAGMLSLSSARPAALIGVFISVTTIPAAGYAAVAAALGVWRECGQSLLQLTINLVGIVAAGVITLLVRNHFRH